MHRTSSFYWKHYLQRQPQISQVSIVRSLCVTSAICLIRKLAHPGFRFLYNVDSWANIRGEQEFEDNTDLKANQMNSRREYNLTSLDTCSETVENEHARTRKGGPPIFSSHDQALASWYLSPQTHAWPRLQLHTCPKLPTSFDRYSTFPKEKKRNAVCCSHGPIKINTGFIKPV